VGNTKTTTSGNVILKSVLAGFLRKLLEMEISKGNYTKFHGGMGIHDFSHITNHNLKRVGDIASLENEG